MASHGSTADGSATPAAPSEVRLARPDEYAVAGNLVADVYERDGFADGDYLAVLRDAGTRAAQAALLVAVEPDGRVLGTLTHADGGTPWADVAETDEAEFRMLAVAPEARGRGVAERLVRASVERARASGKRRLVLSSQPGMAAAHRLYRRLAFERAPHRDWSPTPGMRPLTVFSLELAAPVPDAAESQPAARPTGRPNASPSRRGRLPA